jgi:hypothetical protein
MGYHMEYGLIAQLHFLIDSKNRILFRIEEVVNFFEEDDKLIADKKEAELVSDDMDHFFSELLKVSIKSLYFFFRVKASISKFLILPFASNPEPFMLLF